eukprot:comp11562_c0_seq1/m.6032 comp11562_c0_seq1/g.6032  ORF comp11562_c0_seq1/g.6032 comp11562_c0_seq1/m.6032 type:complete len:202 (-) comp11562_c0_seq1:283-888(-)
MSDLYLSIVRRRNTCEIIQAVSSAEKFKGSTESLVFYHLYDDDYRPLKRELALEKAVDEEFGAELVTFNGALFVCCVQRNSPAFHAGLQFGDQLLAVNEQDLGSTTVDTAKAILRSLDNVVLSTCDSPLTRTYLLQRQGPKDKWGFTFKDRRITDVKPNTPAAAVELPVGMDNRGDRRLQCAVERQQAAGQADSQPGTGGR